jgi:hypothetical protein
MQRTAVHKRKVRPNLVVVVIALSWSLIAAHVPVAAGAVQPTHISGHL